jgi:DNA-binding FadR family transcriptional regulator
MKLTEESTLPTTSTTILTNIPSSTRNRMARRAANLSTEEYDRLLEAVDADDVDTLRDLLDKTKTQIEKEKSTENTERVFYKVISILLGLVHLPIVD